VDANAMPNHLRALRAVGVPYSDDEIAKAAEDVRDKTELTALIAYLQSLGRALK
jgi:cytochrome c oxidase cbb3-type subunit 2